MGYQLELRHFKYFKAVAEELNYRRAAERLFISQPGLSRQIKQMEEIIGASLFQRTRQKVEMTPAGSYLKNEIDFILNHLELTIQQVAMIDQGSSGEIRIGFLGSAIQKVLPDFLVNMNAQYPDIHTSLQEMSNQAQIEAIEKDKLDLGFVRIARVPNGIKLQAVHNDSFSVALPKNHPITEKSFRNVGQLSEESFILFSSDYSPLYFDNIMSICEDQGFRPKISHKSVHAHTIFKLVENGLGVAIIPTTLKHGFDLEIKFIEMKNIPQRTTLSAAWKEGNRNPAMRNALGILLEK